MSYPTRSDRVKGSAFAWTWLMSLRLPFTPAGRTLESQPSDVRRGLGDRLAFWHVDVLAHRLGALR